MCAWLCDHVHICFKDFLVTGDNSNPEPPCTQCLPILKWPGRAPEQQLRGSLGLSLSSLAWPPQSLKSACPVLSSPASSSQPVSSGPAKLLSTQHELTQAKTPSSQGSHLAVLFVHLGRSALPPQGKGEERFVSPSS